jgi:hypothetical protein
MNYPDILRIWPYLGDPPRPSPSTPLLPSLLDFRCSAPKNPPLYWIFPAVSRPLAQQPKSNITRGCVTVPTNGVQPTISASSSSSDNVKTYAVNVLRDEGIVGTNCAGDAFVGGLLGALAAIKSLGGALGAVCIMQAAVQADEGEGFVVERKRTFIWMYRCLSSIPSCLAPMSTPFSWYFCPTPV